ncbi:hypothetical protein ACFPIJ_56900 [Dactylosporangium cerinum]|uniref:Uncharacterized protein n=1 Tax=Dactylosporangium cerinum TaxID=1434730 RepID=A0ABV9WIB6_9ACTN
MTIERTVLVTIAVSDDIDGLLRDVAAARRRAEKADPGDRDDVVRYEALCARLESTAMEIASAGRAPVTAAEAPPDPFVRRGNVVDVFVTQPLEAGTAQWTWDAAAGVAPAAEAWRSQSGSGGRRAVEERFRGQIEAAVSDAATDRSAALSPSGVNNRVITEVLRQFVAGDPGRRRDVPVVYRDGSAASAPFPLRCLRLLDESSGPVDLELRLALLSIRHTEMDPVIDGAWLRNADVSRPRPAGQTDDFVYRASVQQLDALFGDGVDRLRIIMFQTGLDTAVVGFYRAVVDRLLRRPGSLEVVPMFYAAGGGDAGATVTQSANFEPGAVWAAG